MGERGVNCTSVASASFCRHFRSNIAFPEPLCSLPCDTRHCPWCSEASLRKNANPSVMIAAKVLGNIFYTIVSTSSSWCFKDELCFVWPFLSDPLLNSEVFIAKAKLNRLSLCTDPFLMTTLSACLFSLAKWSSSFLCRCLSSCIRREQLISKMATILDISAFSSSLFLISSTRLGSE